jgi:hypothetical protein
MQDLRSARNELGARLRRPGAGRKSAVTQQPELPAALERLIEDAIRGDPTSPLRWVSRSQRHLVKALTAQGFKVSQRVVGKLLRELNYSCQANRKTREGSNNPDRNAQFEHVNATVQAAITAGEPAISVDTKKKELVGDFKNHGRELRPQGDPEPVRVHDFKIPELGKVAPYGVYDIAANHGWVSVGISADTGAFAVESIRRWWYKLGKPRYPNATCLTITADCGGSNGPQVKLWKRELPTSRQRDGSEDHGRPPAAGHQQMEPDRTPAIRLHYHELARQAAGEPPGDCATDRRHHYRDRPQGLLRDRRQPLSERSGGDRWRDPGDQHHAGQFPRRVELYDRSQSTTAVTHLFSLRS